MWDWTKYWQTLVQICLKDQCLGLHVIIRGWNIFHAHETDLPLLFPQIEHLLMYTKYPLKWKLFDSCGYWSFVSELHYCSILKTTTGQVLMNVFYLLAKKEPQLIFSQDHHRSSAPLASFSSWDIPGQSTVTSGSLEMALNTDTEG